MVPPVRRVTGGDTDWQFRSLAPGQTADWQHGLLALLLLRMGLRGILLLAVEAAGWNQQRRMSALGEVLRCEDGDED